MRPKVIGGAAKSRMTNFQRRKALPEPGGPITQPRVLRVYAYEKCDTCRRALKFLGARGLRAEVVPIREQPPSLAELRKVLRALDGDLRRLFNTSGKEYRALGLKDRLPAMTGAQALEALSRNGNLVKRPFLVTAAGGTTGFNEAEWRALLEPE
jgi:arsenate reductase (glutaredoxin)